MSKTYKIISVTVKHPVLGNIPKQNIEYYEDGKMALKEFYPGDPSHIREGYEPADKNQPVKESGLISALKKATPEEIAEIKKLLS